MTIRQARFLLTNSIAKLSAIYLSMFLVSLVFFLSLLCTVVSITKWQARESKERNNQMEWKCLAISLFIKTRANCRDTRFNIGTSHFRIFLRLDAALFFFYSYFAAAKRSSSRKKRWRRNNKRKKENLQNTFVPIMPKDLGPKFSQ